MSGTSLSGVVEDFLRDSGLEWEPGSREGEFVVTLPGELSGLEQWWVIALAGVLYLIEFAADKIPVVDSAWDAIHTFIRVPAGALLAASVPTRDGGRLRTPLSAGKMR